jgi:hypothetical protein
MAVKINQSIVDKKEKKDKKRNRGDSDEVMRAFYNNALLITSHIMATTIL